MKKYKSEKFSQEDLDNFMDKEEERLKKIDKKIEYPIFLREMLFRIDRDVDFSENNIKQFKKDNKASEIRKLEKEKIFLEEKKIELKAIEKTIESLEKIDDREDIAFNFLILKMLGETRDLLYNRIDERVNWLKEDIRYYILLILIVIIIIKIFL